MGKVISFMNNKGGVAKTMSAFNIGILWANIGKKILFIDLDSQANLTNMVSSDDPRYESRKWDNTIEDAFVIGPRLNPLPILPSRYNNVDFVPADLKLSSFDVETSNITLKVYLLKDLIAPIKNNYDYIIIDCPPALGGIIMNAMVASDGIVLVSTPDQPSLDGMHMVVGVYNEVLADERLNPYLKFLGCLITRVENDTINKSYIGLIEEEFGAYVIKPFIRKNTKLNQSVSMHHVHIVNGVTIVHSHPYHKTDDGRPDHEHGYAKFQLLHQLSVLQITGAAFVAILLAAFYSFIRNLSFAPVYPDYIVPFRGRRTLRAPPIF